jgi:hypothetical protein
VKIKLFREICVEYCGENSVHTVGVDGVVSITKDSKEPRTYDLHFQDETITKVHGVTFAESVNTVVGDEE